MTRVIVIADSGPVMAQLTRAVERIGDIEIVRYASGRSPAGRLVAGHAPDLVLIGELGRRAVALERLAEIRAAAPATQVVVLASDPGAAWLADALRAGAAAVLPGDVDDRSLGLVLHDVLTPALAA